MSTSKCLSVVMLALIVAAMAAVSGQGQSDKQVPVDHIMVDGERLPPLVRGEPLIGTVVAFAAPQDTGQDSAVNQWLERQGWMLCDGRALKEAEYPMLFDLIGRSHGAGYANDGSGTHVGEAQFNIPDYRGRFLRGVSRGTNRDPDIDIRNAMNVEGNEKDLVGSVQGAATARPVRSVFATDVNEDHVHDGETARDGEHEHKVPHDNGRSGSRFALARIANRDSASNGTHIVDGGKHSHKFRTDPAGGHSHEIVQGGDNETRPINANVNWIIKVKYQTAN